MREQTCCFSGHRTLDADIMPILAEKTRKQIKNLIGQGVRFFGVGGALGFDTMAAELLFQLRGSCYPHIRVILVYPFDGFTRRWSAEQQRHYHALLPLFNKIVCVSTVPSRQAYLARNRHMVDHSAHCICYCHYPTGGTAYTVSYAKRRGLHIYNMGDYDVASL